MTCGGPLDTKESGKKVTIAGYSIRPHNLIAKRLLMRTCAIIALA
jgi:hypothetical protein